MQTPISLQKVQIIRVGSGVRYIQKRRRRQKFLAYLGSAYAVLSPCISHFSPARRP